MLGVFAGVGQLEGSPELYWRFLGALEHLLPAGAPLLSSDAVEGLVKRFIAAPGSVPTGNITRGPGFTAHNLIGIALVATSLMVN